MGFNKIKEKIGRFVLDAAVLLSAGWSMFLNKVYAKADLMAVDTNIEYAKDDSVTTVLDIAIIIIIAALVVLALAGIYRMKKKEKQDELDDETRMIQNKKEQDL